MEARLLSLTTAWRTCDDPRAMQEKRFKGRTVFRLASVPTGRKLLGKQSTLKPPEPLEVKPQKIQDSKLQVVPPPTSQASNPLAAEYKDTFRERLFQALAADGSYDGLESFVTKSLDDFDPQTGEAYAHDTWAELPTMWVRLHRVPRTTLFVPGEQLQGGPVLSDLSGARVTITLGDYGSMMLSEDVWTSVGEKPLAVEMVRVATCLEKKDLLVHEVLKLPILTCTSHRPDVPRDFPLLLSLRSQSDESTNLRTCPSGPGVPLVSGPRASRIIAVL